MVTSKRKSAQSVSFETNQALDVRRSAVSLAVAAALPGAIALPQVAVAQDDSQVIEEVVATGYRSSLRNAMMMKQNNESIVEALTAEDIGKLPDASIAESLARLHSNFCDRLNFLTSGQRHSFALHAGPLSA